MLDGREWTAASHEKFSLFLGTQARRRLGDVDGAVLSRVRRYGYCSTVNGGYVGVSLLMKNQVCILRVLVFPGFASR